jgi:hypothetical protein
MLVSMKSWGPWIRAVDMALSGEVDDGTGLMMRAAAGSTRARVTNVALHEDVAGVALQAAQGFQVAGVGEFVEVDHRLIRSGPASRGRSCCR